MKFNVFPTQNIESTWWIRLIKVLIIVLTIIYALIFYWNTLRIDLWRQPYYIYSFESDFNSHREPIINCDGVPGKCFGGQNGNSSGIVLAYQTFAPQGNSEVNTINPMTYANGTFSQPLTDDQVLSVLEARGQITNSLKAKDINDVKEFIKNDVFWLIVSTLLFFLLLTQVVLRITLYIIYGKKK